MPHHHHHRHHAHHHDSCSAHEEHCPCCCHDEGCGQHHHQEHGHADFAGELIELADAAWMEVLKEKIKEQIIASHGKQMDKLAKLVSESNNMRWKHKLAGNKVANDYREKLAGYFKSE